MSLEQAREKAREQEAVEQDFERRLTNSWKIALITVVVGIALGIWVEKLGFSHSLSDLLLSLVGVLIVVLVVVSLVAQAFGAHPHKARAKKQD